MGVSMTVSVTEAPQRSSFVTVLAWIFIVISGYMTLGGIFQNIMLARFLPQMGLEAALATHSAADVGLPSFFAFMFRYFQLIAAVTLVVAVATLAASIGLLKRENWARRFFIALMTVGIVWNVVMVILQQVMISQMAGFGAPADFRAQLQFMRVAVFVVSLIMAIAMSVLFWWIIRKLRSAPIVAEFAPVGHPLTS